MCTVQKVEARISLPRHTEVEVGPRVRGVWVEMTLGLEGCVGIILARFPSLLGTLGKLFYFFDSELVIESKES